MARSKPEDLKEVVGEMVRSQSSVEITRDAKGAAKFCVKVYADDVGEAQEKALKTLRDLDGALGTGTGAGDGKPPPLNEG